jgi:hypothetical protein
MRNCQNPDLRWKGIRRPRRSRLIWGAASLAVASVRFSRAGPRPVSVTTIPLPVSDHARKFQTDPLLGREGNRLAVDQLAQYLVFQITESVDCAALEPAEGPHDQENWDWNAQ